MIPMIYITYWNIIAMCHISEYLKSGICTELTGPIHFDNQILNSSIQQINFRVSDLIGVVDEVKRVQMENAQKNERMVRNLGSQINSYAAQISS